MFDRRNGIVLTDLLFNWLGGLLAETKLEDWPKAGLPWVVFWLKELMVWGTLEPVAAYLLARGISTTRIEAETTALRYYQLGESEEDADELLNAVTIRSWAEVLMKPSIDQSPWQGAQVARPVKLLRKFDRSSKRDWLVLPTRIRKQASRELSADRVSTVRRVKRVGGGEGERSPF